MSFEIISIPSYDRKARQLAKKYPSLKDELQQLKSALTTNPKYGTPIGHDCYKIRLAIASKGKGKSGGARVITHVYVAHNKVYLLSIYDKSELEDLSDKDLLNLINAIR